MSSRFNKKLFTIVVIEEQEHILLGFKKRGIGEGKFNICPAFFTKYVLSTQTKLLIFWVRSKILLAVILCRPRPKFGYLLNIFASFANRL